ncbi:hypothetical protein EVA_06543 [gut metagenome]|uniref:Uncharacterized protein n=1 Tax=gut metagenome TaxID=749906 RepID=J9GDD3_9ZZZZ
MVEARQDILESFHLAHRDLREINYEDVMERAFEVDRQTVEHFEGKESVLGKLAEATEKVSPTVPLTNTRKQNDKEAGYED